MKNTLGDLNNHLFAQLERLSDEDLEGEKLKEEILRAKAITDVSKNIIENANLVLEGEKFKSETLGRSSVKIPNMLEGEHEPERG